MALEAARGLAGAGAAVERVGLEVLHVLQPGHVGGEVLDAARDAVQPGQRGGEPGDQGLEGDQQADRDVPLDRAHTADPQDQRAVQGGERRRDHAQPGARHAEPLLLLQGGGVLPGPLAEVAVLTARRLHRLDELQAGVGGVGEPGRVGAQLRRAGGAQPDDDPHGHDVQQGHADADERQLRVVGVEQHRVQHDHDRVHARRREVTGQGLGDRVVGLEPLHQVGRAALGEERHRQPQQVPQEPGAGQGGGDDAAVQQVRLLEPGQHDREQHARRHRREQHPEQRGLVPDQELVDVGAAERGHRRTDRHQQQARQDGGGHGARGAPQPGGHRTQDTGLAPAPGEVLAGLHDQHDAGEAAVEVLHRDEAAALAGVVDVDAPAAEAAAHAVVDDVVVELPEQDGRRLHLGEGGQIHLHALGRQAVTAGRLQQVAGARAVTGDTAGDAQLLQRDVLAVVAEHHRQGGGAALHGLHLEHGGRADRLGLALGHLAFRRGGAAPAPGLLRGRAHGSSQSTGRWSASRIDPVASVMEVSLYGGPSADDHR